MISTPWQDRLQEAVTVALTVVALFALLSLIQLHDWGVPFISLTVISLVLFVVAVVAVYRFGLRGFSILWILLLLYWLLYVWEAYPSDSFMSRGAHPFLTRGLGMSGAFIRWSSVALPVFFAMWIALYRVGRAKGRVLASILAAWIVLLALAQHFFDIAWDVIPPPYPERFVAIGSLIFFVPIPLVGCGYFALFVQRERRLPDA